MRNFMPVTYIYLGVKLEKGQVVPWCQKCIYNILDLLDHPIHN